MTICELCGEPMPAGEEMFTYHGYSGPCPKPPLPAAPAPPAPAESPFTTALRKMASYLPACSSTIHQAADTIDRLNAEKELLIKEVEGLKTKDQDFHDTVWALIAALTGTDDRAEQKLIFDRAGNKPSDYGRTIHDALKAADEVASQAMELIESCNLADPGVYRYTIEDVQAALTRYKAARSKNE